MTQSQRVENVLREKKITGNAARKIRHFFGDMPDNIDVHLIGLEVNHDPSCNRIEVSGVPCNCDPEIRARVNIAGALAWLVIE